MTQQIVILMLLLLGVPELADAQRDKLGMGEALDARVTRSGVATIVETPPAPKLEGQATPTKLAPEVALALGFLVQWGKGQSTAPPSAFDPSVRLIVNGTAHTVTDARLVLPIRGLARVPEGVRVTTMTVQLGASTIITGTGLVHVGRGRVTHVELTTK